MTQETAVRIAEALERLATAEEHRNALLGGPEVETDDEEGDDGDE